MTKDKQLLIVSKKIQTWIKAHPHKATIVWDVIHEFDDAISALEAEIKEQESNQNKIQQMTDEFYKDKTSQNQIGFSTDEELREII